MDSSLAEADVVDGPREIGAGGAGEAGVDAGVLRQAVQVGDPYRERFPGEGAESFARSLWDMQVFEGRIYLGAGDLWTNSGPIPVYSFAGGEKPGFQLESTLEEESIPLLRAFGDTLVVPGADATEPGWDLGNIYFKREGLWTKKRTVPEAAHVYDAVLFQSRLFVSVTTETDQYRVLLSSDLGDHWTAPPKPMFGRLAALDDSLLVLRNFPPAGESSLYRYRNNDVEEYQTDLFPQSSTLSVSRLERFKEGVVYLTNPALNVKPHYCVYYLTDLEKGPTVIDNWGGAPGATPKDLLVRQSGLFLLSVGAEGDKYRTQIVHSKDLASWIVVAEVVLPALPLSFEELGGVFYVGLGNNLSASGSVWLLR